MRSARAQTGRKARDIVIGAMAGITATAAMTVAADAWFRRLPAGERYPLPPRELVERAAEGLGAARDATGPELQAATLAGHFAFGAVAGALYAAFPRGSGALTSPAGGIVYGLGVWTASYLGWVPGLGLLRPATRHPARRNALMIGVHVVWGAVLGLVADRLSGALAPIRGGPHEDR